MTNGDVALVLDQMLAAARLAISYVDGMQEDDFMADTRTQQAVALNLLIVGEAAARLGRDHPDFLGQTPEAPWRDMIGMRNRIAHGYFDLNLRVVWQTVLTALPELVYRLQPIRDEIAAPGGPRESLPSDEI
ncbi:MAG: DUF86 domain-containing protein [Methylocystis sp.]